MGLVRSMNEMEIVATLVFIKIKLLRKIFYTNTQHIEHTKHTEHTHLYIQ